MSTALAVAGGDLEQAVTDMWHCLQKMTKQMKAALVVDTARSSLSTAVFGGSFVLTGNLLSPYIGAVTCDLLFSYYQRSKYEQLKTRVEQHLKRMLEGLMEMKAAKSQVHTSHIPKSFCILHSNSDNPCFWYLMVPHIWCRLLGSADCMFCFAIVPHLFLFCIERHDNL